MSEWQKIQLGSVVKNISETYKFTDSQVIFLNTSDVYNNKILHSTYSSPDILPGQAKKRIKNGDLLFSEIRPVNKRFSIVNVYNPERYVVSTKLMVLRCTPKIDIEYLRFLLTSQEQLEYLQMIAEDRSGTFPQITFEHISSIWVELPPFDEQKAITSVLSSLDDKIGLLHRQNKTLEAMAETLFRQWFVEEAQDDWEEVNVLNIFSLVGGGTPKTSIDEYWNGNIPWISGGDISQSHKGFISKTEKSITELGLKNSSTKLLPKLSTIISARGTVGKYALLEQEMCFSQSNYGIIPKGHNCYYFVYLLIGFIVDELLSAAYGSVFDTITTRTFESVDLKLPEMTVIANFEKTVIEFFKKKELNTKQIQTLEKLRDTLLPKLMSGEVRVNYTPEEIKQ